MLIILLFFPLFFLPQLIISQPKDLKFDRLTIEQGLPVARVFSIVQDSRGFIWIGTEGGLCRFDGYNFKIFKSSPDKKGSLSSATIGCLYEDSKGILWVGTIEGLNKFIKSDESFVTYKNNPDDPNSISDNHITSIIEDKDGILWLGTQNGGLNGFDRESGRFIAYKNNPGDSNSLSSNYIRSIYEDRAGNLWLATDGGGLNKFDRKNNKLSLRDKFTRYRHNKQNPNSISSDSITSVYEDKKGNLWIGTSTNGLNKLVFGEVKGSDIKNYKFSRYFLNPPKMVISMCEDENNLLWLLIEGGLVIFDPESENYTKYEDTPGIVGPVKSSIYRDKNGIIWMTTFQGVSYYNKYRWKFKNYLNKPQVVPTGKEISDSEQHDVWSICDDRNDNLYIGTESGLYVLDSKRENARKILYNKAHTEGMQDNWVNVLNPAIPDILLITMNPYMYKYDINTGAISSYKNIPGLFDISAFFIDKEGLLWAGTFKEGIKVFNKEMTEIARIKHNNDDPSSLSGAGIPFINQDKDGVIWVGTESGLDKLNSKHSKQGNKDTLYFEITHYKSNKEDSTSLSGDFVMSFFEDEKGFLWFGTSGGLNKLDKKLDKFTHYTEDDGLPDNVVYCILPDNSGNLWLSTNKGLSKFNPEAGTFRNFNIGDGLSAEEYTLGAYYKSKKGELFFGGVNGLDAFYPDSIKDNPHIPPVVITSFKVFNKEAELEKSILETDEITLSYKDNFISFEFSALDYTNPSKNQYTYKLEGVDKDWVKTTASKREAGYTDVDPGEYVFRVKGSNSDGVWNEEGASIKLMITPPWWQRWWFRVIGVLTIMGLAGYVFNQRISKIKKEKKAQEEFTGQLINTQERERKRIAAELHDSLGQNLLIIKNKLLSEMKTQKENTKLSELSDLTSATLQEVRSISYNLHPYQLEQLGLTKAIGSIIKSVSESSRIKFRTVLDNIDRTFDSQSEINIYRVIQECMNNIIKHSSASEVEMNLRKEEAHISISISDNGKGFNAEHIKEGGGGFGLKGISERVKLLGGKFNISSAPGAGTKIFITIPLM